MPRLLYASSKNPAVEHKSGIEKESQGAYEKVRRRAGVAPSVCRMNADEHLM